jgi:hypothetical protein
MVFRPEQLTTNKKGNNMIEGQEEVVSQSDEKESAAPKDNRRRAPDYIKGYEWATKAIGTEEFPKVVELITTQLNGDKEKALFTLRGVETALRRLKNDLQEVADEEAAVQRDQAKRLSDQEQLKAMKEKYSQIK